MTISENSWVTYIDNLRKVSDEAAHKFEEYYLRVANPFSEMGRKSLTWYAFVLGRDYGEAAAELACEMYDSMVAAAGLEMGRPAGWIKPAVPAPTATYSEAAKTVNGVLKVSQNPDEMAGAVSRLVKMAGVDTIMKNALRDGAEWAWIPHGDTCAFCITLASQGWQPASKKALKNGHAEHIHANCDCTYAVRFNSQTEVEGYDPKKYLKMYNATSGTPEEKINAMRRKFYAENSEKINEQKRSAYAKRKEREESSAEELNI